jgi:hypothetical protein
MTAVFVILIFAFLFLVYLIADIAEKKKSSSPQLTISNPRQDSSVIEVQSSASANINVDLVIADDMDVFRNHIGEDCADMSHLTPSEAKRELEDRKEAGEFIPSDEYRGYMNAIASKNDDKWLLDIQFMSPEDTHKWFMKKMLNDVHMSSAVWEAVCDNVAPMHEDELLKKLDSVTPGRVIGWVKARKHEGYFFSEAVYEKAKAIYNGEIDNRKRKPRANKH